MTTTRYVVAPREPTHVMAMAANDAFPTTGETTCSQIGQQIYTAMLAAIPDDPNAPVLVDRAELEALKRDVARLDFLESLMKRTGTFGHKNTVWPLDTDLHIGSRGASLFARSGFGSNCEFSVGAETVRGTIDAAMHAASEVKS